MKQCNTDNNVIVRYFRGITEQFGSKYAEMLRDGKAFPADDDAPFLSVIMRTQGNRPDALREAILCLCAQTNTDFELLVMGHNLTDDAKVSVCEVLDECPEWFRKQTRLIEVKGGTRTTPLEQGFDNAKGLYVSIFDDDDLVFDNWVEAFYDLYREKAGTVLHAYCVAQDWRVETFKNTKALAVAGASNNIFCKNFNFYEQLSINSCPIMTLAFPLFAYRDLKIRFDEKLTTTEDWDFLMRTAFICGVSDTPVVTSIYRQWKNSTNSRILHNKSEWDKNRKYIQKKLDAMTTPVEIKNISGIKTGQGQGAYTVLKKIEIFIDDGEGFCGDKTATMEFDGTENGWIAKLSNLGDFNEVRRLRFDPDHYGVIKMNFFKTHIFDESGREIACKPSFLRSNYVKVGKSYLFLTLDPQMILIPSRPIVHGDIALEFNNNRAVSVWYIFLGMLCFLPSYAIRQAVRYSYRLIRTILHRK